MTGPILSAHGLIKRYGRVTALDHADFELLPGEILAVIGDNGAGKSTLIKACPERSSPDHGEIRLAGEAGAFPLADGRARRRDRDRLPEPRAVAGAVDRRQHVPRPRAPQARARSGSWFRKLDRAAMQKEAREHLNSLGLLTIQNIRQAVETLSGGQRQGVAVVRAAAFGSRVVIMDEPTAALGVKEIRRVLELMLDVKRRGLPIVLISHNMPHVFEVADRIHIHRLGRRIAVDRPQAIFDVRRGRDHDRRHAAAAHAGSGLIRDRSASSGRIAASAQPPGLAAAGCVEVPVDGEDVRLAHPQDVALPAGIPSSSPRSSTGRAQCSRWIARG